MGLEFRFIVPIFWREGMVEIFKKKKKAVI
jgi:hypothetical protein